MIEKWQINKNEHDDDDDEKKSILSVNDTLYGYPYVKQFGEI